MRTQPMELRPYIQMGWGKTASPAASPASVFVVCVTTTAVVFLNKDAINVFKLHNFVIPLLVLKKTKHSPLSTKYNKILACPYVLCFTLYSVLMVM